jgi:branched-chain amino acid transport system substrate-binding protein
VREYQKVVGDSWRTRSSATTAWKVSSTPSWWCAPAEDAGALTRAKLISTLESLTNEDLGGFAITYSKQSNLGSRFVALTMIRADGTFAR